MGCDGGTIPRRDELVRTKQKDEKKDANSENAFKWKHCAISQQALKEPIVACDLGRLYNMEAVIQYLLSRAETPREVAAHIRQLKNVTQLVLTDNPAYRDVQSRGSEYVDHAVAPYICPASGLEMNGKYKFVFNRLCGCVFSERARKNVNTEKCLKCGGPMEANELVTLNPSDDERLVLEARMLERRVAAKAARKKVKKEVVVKDELVVKDEPEEASSSSSQSGTAATASASTAKATKMKASTSGASAASKDMAGPAPKKIKQEPQPARKKEREPSGAMAAGPAKLILPAKATASYSIANDPNASEALKSLFTTHETARNKPKAHWITHNPLFY